MTGKRRPYVFINMAMTADGKITSARREYPTFTSAQDRLHMDRLRARADAILVGAGTLRADDPPMHVRDAALRAERQQTGKPRGLLNVVVSSALDLDPALKFFTEPSATGRIIATVEEAPQAKAQALSAHAEIWRIGRGAVDIPLLLAQLHDRGVGNLLVEGGGELNWCFLAAGAVDELNLTLCPALLGGRDAPTLLEGSGWSMDERSRLQLLDATPIGDEVFMRYRILPRVDG